MEAGGAGGERGAEEQKSGSWCEKPPPPLTRAGRNGPDHAHGLAVAAKGAFGHPPKLPAWSTGQELLRRFRGLQLHAATPDERGAQLL